MMTSRLDRLLALLHSGPSEAARAAAARQLGQIQKEHPEQLHTLLQRVLTYLFNEAWETRRAAALALEAIAEAVPPWWPTHPEDIDVEAEAAARADAEGAWLNFESFAMATVLAHGTPLLASGGAEFELSGGALENPRERLLRQRAVLLGQLGLDTIGKAVGGDGTRELTNLIGERDVECSSAATPASRSTPAVTSSGGGGAASAAAQALAAQLSDGGALSERARNAIKRKAKQAAREACGGIVAMSTAGSASDAIASSRAAKRARVDGDGDEDGAGSGSGAGGSALEADAAAEAAAAAAVGSWEASMHWPFEPLCAELRCSLFNPRWQRRHGAALGLRAILKIHAASGIRAGAQTRGLGGDRPPCTLLFAPCGRHAHTATLLLASLRPPLRRVRSVRALMCGQPARLAPCGEQ